MRSPTRAQRVHERKMLNVRGWGFQMLEDSPKSYMFKHTKCPECEGVMAGLDAETVEAYCRKNVEIVSPFLRKLIPRCQTRREEVERSIFLRGGAHHRKITLRARKHLPAHNDCFVSCSYYRVVNQ